MNIAAIGDFEAKPSGRPFQRLSKVKQAQRKWKRQQKARDEGKNDKD